MANEKENAEKLVTALKEILVNLKSIRGIKGLIGAAPTIVHKVEDISKGIGLSGSEKRKLAIEVGSSLIPTPRWVPKFIVEYLLGVAIDKAVELYNKKFGNAWIHKIVAQ